ncbi:hypothetical protein [uncultured Methylobacterium sp.]|uniref:hypothetical protein n=1 Tax=uncultured Methylobacterium sp. TaxID=157278 RepID=UPI0035CB62C9
MRATAQDCLLPDFPGGAAAIHPRATPAARSLGLVGRDGLVRRLQVLVAGARRPVCLAGPAGSGSTAVASAVADGLARRTRVLGIRCTPTTTFARLTQSLAEGLGSDRPSGRTAIVMADVGAVAEPGFLRALAHLGAGVPTVGWLIAGVPQGVPGAQAVPAPLLSASETAFAVDAAVARHGAAISKVARAAAATLARGLPGLADRLVAEAWTAAVAAGDDAIGLPHLRTAARSLGQRDVGERGGEPEPGGEAEDQRAVRPARQPRRHGAGDERRGGHRLRIEPGAGLQLVDAAPGLGDLVGEEALLLPEPAEGERRVALADRRLPPGRLRASAANVGSVQVKAVRITSVSLTNTTLNDAR